MRLSLRLLRACTLFCAGLMLSMNSSGATFSAGIENSRWSLSESIFACSLSHPVPGYGQAIFFHRAGDELRFFLDTPQNRMRPGQAALVLEAPAWRGGEPVRDLGFVPVEHSERPIELGESQAYQMMAAMMQGMMPTFTRRARFSDDPVRVRISHINFSQRVEDFHRCTSGLLPVNFDQVERSTVLFGVNETSLTDAHRAELDRVVLYIQADSRVTGIYVDGHAGTAGQRLQNRVVSRDRAEAVTDYLVSQGISPDMISTRFHGDRYPLAGQPNSRNRRTTVRLVRDGDDSNIVAGQF